jgi:hypothetical protein
MLDEEIDHIIRDAADKHHPAYNDKAWEKMEKLLDKHLPQKRDGRKYIFFLLLFLLLGGGALLTVYQLNQNKTGPTAGIPSGKISEKQSASISSSQTVGQPGITTTAATENKDDASKPNNVPTSTPVSPGYAVGNDLKQPAINTRVTTADEAAALNKKRTKKGSGKSNMHITSPGADDGNKFGLNNDKAGTNKKSRLKTSDKAKKNVSITAPEPEDEKETASVYTVPVKDETQKNQLPVQQAKEEQKTEPVVEQVNEQPKEELAKAEEKPAKKQDTGTTKPKPVVTPDKKKNKKDIAGNFGITLSAGPDVSFIELNKLGKVTMLYGAGLSYHFANRVTLRTGFYTANKIYDAKPEQYHSTGGYYPYLYNIAAECRVYEIPVSLSYHFARGKKHNWFGNAGLSSFIMKSEYYEYEYKTPGGQYYNYETKVRNENKHYFSVLTLSAGYQYALSKRILLQAEPYIKLPLGGVGLGKVKLNSSGLLFTATIKPFAKK